MKYDSARRHSNMLMRDIRKHIPFFVMLILPLAHVIVFNYAPMYGIVIAFKDYKMNRGIMGSEWVGLYWFKRVFSDPYFLKVLGNTVRISLASMLVTFPVTIAFALLVNELKNLRFKKLTQTISYLPHFLSWVVVGGLVYQLLSPTNGVINVLLMRLGILTEPTFFMAKKELFLPVYLVSVVWKDTGWSIIIYLAAIAGIDVGLYEAAVIEGANRFQKVRYITLPGILPTINTLLILQMGSLISVGFDPVFNLYNEITYEVSDVISTYVFRKGLLGAEYEYTTAVGLAQNVVSFLLVLGGNYLARKTNPEYRII